MGSLCVLFIQVLFHSLRKHRFYRSKPLLVYLLVALSLEGLYTNWLTLNDDVDLLRSLSVVHSHGVYRVYSDISELVITKFCLASDRLFVLTINYNKTEVRDPSLC